MRTTTIACLLLISTLSTAHAQEALFEDAARQMLDEAEGILQRARTGHVIASSVTEPLEATNAFLKAMARSRRRAALTERMNLLAVEAALHDGSLSVQSGSELMDLGYLPSAPRAQLREAILQAWPVTRHQADADPAGAAAAVAALSRTPAAPYQGVLSAALARAADANAPYAAPQPDPGNVGINSVLDGTFGGGGAVFLEGADTWSPERQEQQAAPDMTGFGWQPLAEAKASRYVVKAGDEVELGYGATIFGTGARLQAWWIRPDGSRQQLEDRAVEDDTFMTSGWQDQVLQRGVHRIEVELRFPADGRVFRARTIVIAR